MSLWRLTNLIPSAKKPPASSSPRPPPSAAKRQRRPRRRRRQASITTPTQTPTSPTDNNNNNNNNNNSNPNPTTDPLAETDPAARYNPSILPSSPEFTTTLAAFHALLSDPASTVNSILASKFTPHEQELLRPVGQDGNRPSQALADIQEGNRWRYDELLQSERFKGWAGKADLGFKLTLAWFGLPVAPMGYPGDLAGAGREEEDEVGGGGGELRFLNGYTERVYEKDAGVRAPDDVLEAYCTAGQKRQSKGKQLATSVSLRGGQAEEQASAIFPSGGDNNSGPDGKDRTFATESRLLTLRGGTRRGAAASTISDDQEDWDEPGQHPVPASITEDLAASLYTSLRGFCSGTIERWLPMYGYQGVVWFRADLFHTFIDAVDRLLGLDNRGGVAYNLYLLDKKKDYTDQAVQDEFLSNLDEEALSIWASGPGDWGNDRVAWEWVLDRVGTLEDDKEAYQKALFVAGPGDPIPRKWQPDESHGVLQVVLDWTNETHMDRPDIAYLRMPLNATDFFYSNQFAPWIANICRLLSAGQIPGRPGYPAVPDAWFTVKGQGQGRGGKQLGTYGGLVCPPPLWDALVKQWEEDATALATLQARTGSGDMKDRWHLFLPGVGHPYHRHYILMDEVGNDESVIQRIMGLVESSLSDESFFKLQALEVYLPGTEIFAPEDEAGAILVPLDVEDLDAEFEVVVDHMVDWRDFLEALPGHPPVANGLGLFPQFLTLRPVFEEYTLCDAAEQTRPLVWHPPTTTLARFHDLVARLWSATGHRPAHSEKALIGITQGRHGPSHRNKPKKPDPAAESKPRFIIGPETTDPEWQWILRLIVDPEVFVSPVDKESLPRFRDLNTAEPFGYHDIYETPDSLLYPALKKDQIPRTKRHYDWQMWGEDVTPQLKTIRPWEDQPASVSKYFAPEAAPTGTKSLPIRDKPRETGRWKPASQSVPQSGTASLGSRVEEGQRMREYSYAHPLDVQMQMSTPVNAPPVDSLLDLRHDSVPAVSLSVLTPTEIRRLQLDYHEMRNLALSRTQQCPYPDCGAAFPVNDPSAMQQHLQDEHVAEKCNFGCGEPLFAHWSPEQRYQHFIQKHSAVLQSFMPGQEDYEVQIADLERTDRAREGRWNFCPRCGRDHAMLDAPADRQTHDNVCYPDVQDHEANWSACGTCGGRISGDSTRHKHRKGVDADAPFCGDCSLPLGRFSNAYQVRHLSFCNGHGRDNAKHCPWCGIRLDPDFDARMEHIEGCSKKPSIEADGPIDTVNRVYFTPGASTSPGERADTERVDAPKRRKTTRAGEWKVPEVPPNKSRATVPPATIDADRGGPSSHRGRTRPQPLTNLGSLKRPIRVRSPVASDISSPPSTSHSRRPAEPWLPPPPPRPPTARTAVPPPLAAARPSQRAPAGPAKRTKQVKPVKPARTRTRRIDAKPQPKPPGRLKKTTIPREAAIQRLLEPRPAIEHAYDTRSKHRLPAYNDDALMLSGPRTIMVKAAQAGTRSVSYADPLVRGASPRRGVGERLVPAIRSATRSAPPASESAPSASESASSESESASSASESASSASESAPSGAGAPASGW